MKHMTTAYGKAFGRACLLLVLSLLLVSVTAFAQGEADVTVALTAADLLQEDGSAGFPGVPKGTAREDIPDLLGMDYSTWMEQMGQIKSSGETENAPFTLEGRPAVAAFSLKDGAVRSVTIYLLDDGATDEQWLQTTQAIMDTLSQAAQTEMHTTYTIGDSTVRLSFVPTSSADYVVTEDGAVGFALQIGALGTRLESIMIE